ncbi:MAG: NAD(+) diphosphatase [Deltaproteobacteria bacterium]|nr:NAD(+) diphosphatase [Deltaproteobacteria bacterium]
MNKNSISINGFDRYSFIRSDKSWLNEKIFDENSRIIPIHNLNVLCDTTENPGAVYLTHNDLTQTSDFVDSLVFLGIIDETPCFAIDINSNESASNIMKKKDATFQDLRPVMPLIGSRDNELLVLARFTSYWHSKNQYCGKCGSKTKSSNAGHVRICMNTECNENFFPSMDPAIIVLVSSGDRCLLGRQKEWPEGMYSTLAGFVEPGETIEEAVAREIHEESGVTVEKIEYQHSQPWLFPNSLMLGFIATAKDDEICLGDNELEDARWFTREEIRSDSKILPPKISISHKLIIEWVNCE